MNPRRTYTANAGKDGIMPFIDTWSMSKSKNERVIIVVDFDCFYASVAIRDRPELKDKPVAVVQKHLCATVNYVARSAAHGSVKKMSTVNEALRRCPDIVMIDGSDLLPFRKANQEIVETTRDFFPKTCKIEKNGLDEVFIDVTSMLRSEEYQQYPWHFNGHLYAKNNQDEADFDEEDVHFRRRLMIGSHVASELRQHIFNTTKLTCCAGIATSKLIGKIAVNLHKPNQQSVILPNMAGELISGLAPHEIMGLGHSTINALQQWGRTEYKSVGQLARTFPLHEGMKSIRLLRQAFSPSSSSFGGQLNDENAFRLIQMFHGIDNSDVVDLNQQGDGNENMKDAPKSISVEDACKNCQDLKAVRLIVKILSMRLITLLIEDAKRFGRMRRAKTLSVGFRHRGEGYKSTWRSSRAPVEVSGTNFTCVAGAGLTKVRDAVETKVLKVLRENGDIGVGKPFQLTLIGVGVSNFTYTSGNGPKASNHSFFSSSNTRKAARSNDCPNASFSQSIKIANNAINKSNQIRKVGSMKTKSIATFFNGGCSALKKDTKR